MAYGNWGAWVFRNGEHQPAREDQTPYREDDLAPGYQQAFLKREGLGPHHAVLGSGKIRLCGYKNWPRLYVDGEEVDLSGFVEPLEDYEDADEGRTYKGEIEGHRFEAEGYDYNMVDLLLVEPDGTRWTSRCGYCYGAGWSESEPRDEATFSRA